jgi:ATP-dependent Clp protease ATP-binding subunit ClpC
MSMSAFGGFGSQDPFADLLGRFFGRPPASSPPAVRRVPIGRLLTDSARELLTQASARAQEDGSDDLDTEHLLWATTETEPTRSILAQAGVDPDQLARTVEAALPGTSGRSSAEPGLTPSAKRVSRRRVWPQGMELEVTEAAKRRLAELGHQPEFGARPLRRTLQTELDNRLATLLLDWTVEPGDTIRADVDDAGRLTVAIGRPAASRESHGTADLESPDTENGGAEQ